jgi:hypothetical protein
MSAGRSTIRLGASDYWGVYDHGEGRWVHTFTGGEAREARETSGRRQAERARSQPRSRQERPRETPTRGRPAR